MNATGKQLMQTETRVSVCIKLPHAGIPSMQMEIIKATGKPLMRPEFENANGKHLMQTEIHECKRKQLMQTETRVSVCVKLPHAGIPSMQMEIINAAGNALMQPEFEIANGKHLMQTEIHECNRKKTKRKLEFPFALNCHTPEFHQRKW